MLRLEGIYDESTMQGLKTHSLVHHYAFDFRVRSFNFLQQHRFLELLQKSYDGQDFYFLQFENEKDFVIEKLFEDLRNFFYKNFGSIGSLDQFYLEFSDEQDFSFYDQFESPYYWHLKPEHSLRRLSSARFLKGLCLNYQDLKKLHDQGVLYQYVQNFHQQFVPLMKERHWDLLLRLDWDDDLLPSLFELFDFRFVSLRINNKVEICYRQVDINKMNTGIQFVHNIIFQHSSL